MRIDYFVGYCIVMVINILWTGGLYIEDVMQCHVDKVFA